MLLGVTALLGGGQGASLQLVGFSWERNEGF